MIRLAHPRALEAKFSKLVLINLGFLAFILGCLVPALTPRVIPTADPNILAVIIAGTAAAANTQTAIALSATASPSPTLVESAPVTATITPESMFSSEGTVLLPDADGSTLFTDQTFGYRVRVPAGWLLVRINEREMAEAFSRPEAADPRFMNFLQQAQNNDPQKFRLFGADTNPAQYFSGFVTNFNVFWNPGGKESLDQLVGMLQEQLPLSPLNPSVTYADVGITTSSQPVGIIESVSTLFSSEGWPTNLYQKQVVFRLKAGVLTLVLSTTHEQKNAYLPGFDVMVDQIVFLEQ